MKRCKLTKLAADPNAEFEPATDHSSRAHRGWVENGEPVSPPVDTIVTGTMWAEPRVGQFFYMYDILIDGVTEHGAAYRTSAVREVLPIFGGFLFSTRNSNYKLEVES